MWKDDGTIVLNMREDEDEDVVSGDIGGCLALNLLVCLSFFLLLASSPPLATDSPTLFTFSRQDDDHPHADGGHPHDDHKDELSRTSSIYMKC